MHKILFASSEAYPLIKTGGLGDVSGSLVHALQTLDCDVRLILPAYQTALKQVKHPRHVADVTIPEANATASILETRLPGSRVKTWLVDYPPFFDRPDNPYVDDSGHPWPDNAERFALFARVITTTALDRAGLSWQPDIVHCNDWQTGLVPALLSQESKRPATVFTIHNLSYQGLFPQEMMTALQLPSSFWSPEALEFYGKLSFIKGGLCFADHISTVSPTYAKEIQTPEHGLGLDGLLRHRTHDFTGILNGIDDQVWNPGTDTYLVNPYNWKRLEEKQRNKIVLQKQCKLPVAPEIPMIGLISRLVTQKGIDLIIEILPWLLKKPVQVVLLGSGDTTFTSQLKSLAKKHAKKLFVHIGYNEALAHQIEGSADMFLMPSLFEPCGLNQLYSLRYGTVPIVRAVGGLADTVVDATDDNRKSGTATGFVFHEASTGALQQTIERALDLYQDTDAWKQLMVKGMRQSFTWEKSAKDYLALYNTLLAESDDTTALLYNSAS